MKVPLNYMMLHHNRLADEFDAILNLRSSHAALVADDVLDPTGLSATAVSSSQIDLTWSDASSNESGFVIDYSTDGGNWTRSGTAAADATTYSITGLSPSTLYYVRVGAYDAVGISDYVTDSATTLAAYAGHNAVTFDGTDYLEAAGGVTFAGLQSITVAACISVPSPTSGSNRSVAGWYTSGGTSFYRIAVLTTGAVQFRMNTTAATVTAQTASTSLLSDGLYHVLVGTAYWDGAAGACKLYCDGVEVASAAVSAAITRSEAMYAAIGANNVGGLTFTGNMKYAAFSFFSDTSMYFTDVSAFGTGLVDVDLGADMSTPFGAQPRYGFGGTQVAADWNAGTNLGLDGAMTMHGDGVA